MHARRDHDNSKIRDLSCITTVGNRSICTYIHRPYACSSSGSLPVVTCVQVREWHMHRGLERTGSRMRTPQRLAIFYPHSFPICMAEQILVAATITRPCMHAYIRYHDVSTRALILINFLLVWKWKIKRNRTKSLRPCLVANASMIDDWSSDKTS